MPSEVILPRVDMDMTTGKISKWFVESGAAVTKGQPLFEIETDKAAMEIEAPASGTIRDLAAASGTDIPVGSVVAWIFGEGEAAVAPAPAAAAAQPEPWAQAPAAPAASPPAAPARADPAAPAAAAPADPAERPRATPVARRLARVEGIDLKSITGSGPRGRIQAADVAAAGRTPAPPAAPAPVAAMSPPIPPSPPATAFAAPATATAAPATASATPAKPAAPAGALSMVTLREGEGRPTLLIHGFGADANSWRPMLAGRASARPIHALDLPGHGASPLGASLQGGGAPRGLAAFADLVDALEAHLRASGLPAFDLVGHSLGGALAAALAARGTLDISSVLLLAPAGLGPAINGAFIEGFLRATSEASLTPWMAELVADPAALTPAFVRATLKARQGTDLVTTQARVAAALFPDGTQAFGIRADLARMPVPCRVVVGTADRIIPATQAEALPGRIALHRFPGIGHMPQMEIRDDVIAIINEMAGASR